MIIQGLYQDSTVQHDPINYPSFLALCYFLIIPSSWPYNMHCSQHIRKIKLWNWSNKLVSLPAILRKKKKKRKQALALSLLGWLSNRPGTSVDNGARKSNNWLDQWLSGKLSTGSRVVLSARFPVVKWRPLLLLNQPSNNMVTLPCEQAGVSFRNGF